jgi:hypothetical protein
MEEIADALGHNVDDYDLRSPNPWNKLDGYTNVMATSPRVSVTLHASELSMALKEEIDEHEAPPAYDSTGATFSQSSLTVDLGVQPAANPQNSDTEGMTQKQDEVLPDIDIFEIDKEEDQEHRPRPLDTSTDTDVAQFNDANVGLGIPLSASDPQSIETPGKEQTKEELRPLTQPDLLGPSTQEPFQWSMQPLQPTMPPQQTTMQFLKEKAEQFALSQLIQSARKQGARGQSDTDDERHNESHRPGLLEESYSPSRRRSLWSHLTSMLGGWILSRSNWLTGMHDRWTSSHRFWSRLTGMRGCVLFACVFFIFILADVESLRSLAYDFCHQLAWYRDVNTQLTN